MIPPSPQVPVLTWDVAPAGHKPRTLLPRGGHWRRCQPGEQADGTEGIQTLWRGWILRFWLKACWKCLSKLVPVAGAVR